MCRHLNYIQAYRDGHVVCVDCGLVIDECIYPQLVNHSQPLFEVESEIKTFLADCCDRMFIPVSVMNSIYDEYVHFRSESDFEKIEDRQLLAYSIYFKLKKEDIGKNIEYIASKTGISSKKIWKCEKIDAYLSIPIDIRCLLTPALSTFNLTQNDYEKIIHISFHFEDRHFTPTTMISTLVYMYCKTKKIPINLKKVHSVFGVSSMSIYRCKSYITMDKFHCILENL